MTTRALLAAIPTALLLGLLLATRTGAAKAAWAALAAALTLAFTVFGFAAPSAASLTRNLAGVAAETVFITVTILWILLPALAIHELQTRTGALVTMREALVGAAPDLGGRVLLVGWFFALFIEGAAGFGTPLAIAAPMLVALGVAPVPAVAAALVGHTAGVAFGAVGTPILAQAELVDASAQALGRYTAFLLMGVAWLPALFVVRAAHGADLSHSSRAAVHALAATMLFCAPFATIAVWLGPELPTLSGALLGGIAFVALARRTSKQRAQPGRSVTRAAAPYLILIALIVLTRLFPPIKSAATSVTLAWSLDQSYSGSMLPLYHPGTLLFASFVLGGLIHGVKPRDFAAATAAAARRLAPAVVALIAMLALARVMLHTGMIATLAEAAVASVGESWPAVAPAVGALGSFVTGSATASNILFTNLQEQTARSLGLPVVAILAAQTLGAAVGNAVCPHNIIAGAAAVGVAGREGEILRRTLAPCVLILALAGALALLTTNLG